MTAFWSCLCRPVLLTTSVNSAIYQLLRNGVAESAVRFAQPPSQRPVNAWPCGLMRRATSCGRKSALWEFASRHLSEKPCTGAEDFGDAGNGAARGRKDSRLPPGISESTRLTKPSPDSTSAMKAVVNYITVCGLTGPPCGGPVNVKFRPLRQCRIALKPAAPRQRRSWVGAGSVGLLLQAVTGPIGQRHFSHRPKSAAVFTS